MKKVLIVLAVLCANFAFGQDYYLSSVVPYNKKMKDDIVIKNYSSFKISKVVVSAKGTEIGAVYNLLSYNDEKAYRSHCRLPQYIGSEFSFAIDCPDAKNAEANLSLSFSVGMHDLIVTITSDKDRNPWAYLSQQQPSQQQQPQPMNKKRKFWRTFGIVTGAALVTTAAVVGTVAASKSSGSGSSTSSNSDDVNSSSSSSSSSNDKFPSDASCSSKQKLYWTLEDALSNMKVYPETYYDDDERRNIQNRMRELRKEMIETGCDKSPYKSNMEDWGGIH